MNDDLKLRDCKGVLLFTRIHLIILFHGAGGPDILHTKFRFIKYLLTF